MGKKNKKNKIHLYDRLLKGRIGLYLTILFISSWMFLLGVLVGRGTAPVKFDIEKLSKELAQLKKADMQKQMARVKIDSDAFQSKTDLEFYEELKKTKKIPGTRNQKVKSEGNATSGKKPQQVQRKSPDKNSSKSKSTHKIPPATTEKNLTIQAASLKDRQEAQELVDKLKKKGYLAYKTIGYVPEKGVWFRVRVGQYGSREEASNTLKRLKKDGYDPFLVTR
jgi:septal ring-binding cell division protein DamX